MNTTVVTSQLAILAGGRPTVMAAVPGSRPKFVAMGAVLVSTTAVAALSAGFAMRMALNAPMALAIVIGLFWGGVILSIDRMLVLGMSHEASLRKSLAIAAPRVVLAILLGTVISTPITLQIFHREIETQIKVIQRDAADEFGKQLMNDERFKNLPKQQARVDDLKTRIVSGGGIDPNKDPNVAAADSATATSRQVYDAAHTEYLRLAALAQCELDGTCGSRRPGVGDAYQTAAAAAERQLAVADAAKEELDATQQRQQQSLTAAGSEARDANTRSLDQARTDLAAADSDLNHVTAAKNELQAAFDARNADNTGILIRLEALEQVSAGHPMLVWAHRLLWAFFTAIELLPVLVKLLMSIGARSAYDRGVESSDNADENIFEIHHQTRTVLETSRADLAVAAEADRIERQKKVAIRVNEQVVAHQTAVIESALELWAHHAKEGSREQLDEYDRQLNAQRAMTPPPQYIHNVPVPGAAQAVHPHGRAHGQAHNAYIAGAQLPDPRLL